MRIFITGGAGFIGSAVIRQFIKETTCQIINIDKLTYAGNLESLEDIANDKRYTFSKTDICDAKEINRLFSDFEPDAVMHLAAESHVDRSIDGPAEFIKTNIFGTFTLLETAKDYWNKIKSRGSKSFVFHHISTDEVFGALGKEGYFTESTPYKPSSPYSSSKAAADHLVRAWHHTYDFPVVTTNCSNNYGPRQFPEKLIPLMIINCLQGKKLPVYGKGENVRDWLFVDDHARALRVVLEKGKKGETYNIGGRSEKKNLDVVRLICSLMDEFRPSSLYKPHESLINYVQDRPGHDYRYAIDSAKIEKELGWRPLESFESGMRKTVAWYLDNERWWKNVQEGVYQGERLGLKGDTQLIS